MLPETQPLADDAGPVRKSDGLADRPLVAVPGPAAAAPQNTPGAPNAALKEAPPKAGEGVDPNHPCAAHLRVLDADSGTVGFAPGALPRKKVAVCGFASTTRPYIYELAKDPEWLLYGLNQLYRHIPRADAWFDIHHNWDEEVVPGTDHREWARQCGIPFYTIGRHADIPTNVRYPMERVLKHFEIDYFTSTIPYMLALVIMEIDGAVREQMRQYAASLVAGGGEPETLDLWSVQRKFYGEYSIAMLGIDLVVGGEYFHEKPCAEFWLGAAALGRGISVIIPKESALCKQRFRYGTDRSVGQGLLTVADIDRYSAAVTADRDEHIKRLYMMEGVLQANTRWRELIELRERGATVEQ